MSVIHKPRHDNPYVMIDKGAINDERLSFKALGLLLYLISKPPDWRICLRQLAATHKEGLDAVRAAMDELIAYGYAQRALKQAPNGHILGYDTIVAEVPFPAAVPEAPQGDSKQIDMPLDDTHASDTPAGSRHTDTGKTDIGKTDVGFSDVGKSHATKECSYQGLKDQESPLIMSPKKKKPSSVSKAHIDAQSQEVLTHLNTITQSAFRSTGLIPQCLRQGYTVDDCLLVLNWIHEDRREREPDWVQNYLDHTTPFRPCNFERYLQKARAWAKQQAERSNPSGISTLAQRVFDQIQASNAQEEADREERRQRRARMLEEAHV